MISDLISTASGPGADWKLAKSKAYKAVKAYPEDPNARVIFALASEQSGHINDAVESARAAVRLDPDNFPAQFHLGRLLVLAQHCEEALGPLKSALRISPGNQETVILLAKASQNTGLYDDAIRYYLPLSRGGRYAGKSEPFNEIAYAYAMKGDYPKAYEYLVQAYKSSQNNPSAVLNLAILCDLHMGKKDVAKKLYQKYIELTLKNPDLKARRSEIDQRMQAL